MVLTGPLLTMSRLISFSDVDVLAVHFSHNNAMIVTMLINSCRVYKILVDGVSTVNILYKGYLDRMEDNPEIARAMISPQT